MLSEPHASEPESTPGAHAQQSSPGAKIINAIPPPGLILLAVVAIQVGSALATQLFPVLGANGTVAVRIIFSAMLLGLAASRRFRSLASIFMRHWQLLIVYGLCITAMNLFFYQSIARIPLGAAVAIEFIGPLGVAALSSRRIGQFAWVALAALGIVLLSPLTGQNLDPLGVLYALLAGTGWALFIVLTGRVTKRIPGNDGLVVGMAVAALTMIPFAIPIIDELVLDPLILLAAIGVALLSTTIPFTLEFEALKRVSARTYGILVSLEPAVAALVGAWLLEERIGTQGIIAVACVVVAAVGITLSDKHNE